MAGSVAPIAAVAGRNKTNVPKNATDQCQAGVGCAPMILTSHAETGDHAASNAAAQSAMQTSHAAYQRTGWALASMRLPSASAPTASPPKKAATTASTAAA